MSDILSRLQEQGGELSALGQRGQELVQGFDTDRLLAQGQEYAYKMGKAQLETLIGQEAVQGLVHGVPVLYKGGRAVAQRLAGMPTTREEALERARQVATTAGQQLQDRIVNDESTGAGPSGEARNFRYNTESGRIETEGGEPATFGAERQAAQRTPLEQQEFESPRDPSMPVGQVPERQDFGDVDLTDRGANERANQRFRQEQESRAELPSEEPELPDVPNIGSGEIRSIGELPVQGEFTGAPSQYTRPGTQLRIAPEPAEPTRFTPQSRPFTQEAPRDPVGRLAEIRERYEAEDIGDPLEFETREVVGSEVTPFQSGERFSAENLPTGRTSFRPPPPGEAPTLSQPSTSLEIPQRDPQDQPLYDRLENLRTPNAPTTQPDIGFDPEELKTDLSSFPEPSGGGSQGPSLLSQDDQLNQRLRTLQQGQRYLDPVVPEESLEERLQNLRGEGPAEPPPEAPSGGAEVGEQLGKLATEEGIADAIPGIGEVIGAGLAIFGGIEAAVQGAEASKMKPPPPAQSAPAFGTAFDSAPVIDSSQYHNI